MAALGNTPIQLYYSNTAGNKPLSANLISGELAINMADGVLYYLSSSNVVSILASNSAVSTATNASANTITLQGGLNTANANIAYIFGINNTQNTWISSNAVYTQAAFDRANTKFSSSGGTISGAVTIQSDLTVTGNISFTGNATTVQITGNTGQFFGYASNGFNALYAGIPTGYFLEPQVTFQVSSNFNGYSGLNMQNINSGANASADLFITADNGTINDGFVDLGMGSSNYNYLGYTLIGKNDGYLFTTGNTTTGGGNMIIGTGLPNDIVFSVNGLNTGNEVARFKYNTGLVLKQPITFADSTTQNTAAAPYAYSNAAFLQANTATNNTIALTGVNLTQNTWIASNAAFTQAAYDQANTSSANTVVTQGVDLYQNTQIAIVQGGLNDANANIVSLFAINNTQNTWIASNSAFTQAAYNQANTANTLAQSGFDKANTASSNTITIQGVDDTQNTWIASNSVFTQAAFDKANTDVTSITLGNPGTFGGATNVAVITVSANGRITAISNTAISAGGGSGGSSSGYLANSVIFANSTGYLANTSNISFFTSNNTLQVTGNVYSSNVFVLNDVIAGLQDGNPLGGATNPIIASIGNTNNFIQTYTINYSNTTQASADFVAYPNNGTDSSGWIDMGITSNAFSQAIYSTTGRNEGYLFMSAPAGSGTSGNLVISTDSTGTFNSIEFYTGGFNASKGTANVVITTQTTSVSNTTGTLVVNGGLGVRGNVYTGNHVITGSGNGITFADGTRMTTAATGGGGSSSGYLANSVIFANNTGYLSNTSALSFFASNNTLQVTGNVIVTGTIGGISPRTFNVATSSTPTPNASNTDQYILSAFGQVGGGIIQIPTGTANDGQRLMIRIKDKGAANALGWITTAGGYRAVGVTLPTTTVAGKVLYVGCIYNSQDAYWDVVSVAQL